MSSTSSSIAIFLVIIIIITIIIVGDQQPLHGYQNGSDIIIHHLFIVDLVHIASMDESYGTYVDDEYFDNHDYDDDTDDDTDDDNDHKEDSYTAAGAAPEAGAVPVPGLREHQNPNKTQT